ncbi:OmpA family protein [Lacihabitans sp. LS3-19]|uniref:OmpA family protein n=1 Tax=Lacihabitans sp. LS3-19 TaxID=2487335 RepID=UPI0020CDD636|nr:OmpA family protein [Lacihabitans sp. LS3-19]
MKTFLAFTFFICVFQLNAQIIKPKETVKRKATDRTNNAIDRNIDKGLDKIEEGIGNIFKKKEKTMKEESERDSDKEEQIEEGNNGKSTSGWSTEESSDTKVNKSTTSEEQPAGKIKFSANSKFDFVPGEKVIGFDDFSETSVGDFPLGWNTNSAAEIVTFNDSPEKWLFMSQDGYFQPDFVSDMPDNFTLEYDIFTRYASNNILNYNFNIYASDNPRSDFSEAYYQNGIYFNWTGGTSSAGFIIYENGQEINKNENLTVKSLDCVGDNNEEPSKVHFAIWRQKNRLRVYVDELKVLDLPQAFNPKLKYNAFKLGSKYMNFSSADNKDEFMVSNVRYAVGAPDTRSKLITEGRFSTTGILFDVNSDQIKASSEGTLKEIAKVLKENPSVKVKIIGHTDSDGADAANQTLSEKRALSVKNALSSDFGITADRMLTEGKGESQPVDKNDTPQGKANNRRVEFVKL